MALTFEEATREAALAADKAVLRTMKKYADGNVTDEDDITGVLVGNLDSTFSGSDVGGLHWSSSVVRHRRGIAAEEAAIGADLVIHVQMKTPTQSYSKGVLIQAKRLEPNTKMTANTHAELVRQCGKMLSVTPAAFVFDYASGKMRCGAATKIAGSPRRDLYENCGWTSYRFFLELFRCPVGDPRITSARVKELPVPMVLSITASGELSVGRDLIG